jgi:hypothetical protein
MAAEHEAVLRKRVRGALDDDRQERDLRAPRERERAVLERAQAAVLRARASGKIMIELPSARCRSHAVIMRAMLSGLPRRSFT